MHLEKLLIWVNTYYENLHVNDKTEARKMLNNHLAQAKEMVGVLEGDEEYRSLFEDDVTRINYALNLIN